MRWPDERYVRVYTRDTGEWLAFGWEAQALLVLALRKCDRAGILWTGPKHARGLAAMVGMPIDVVERSLPLLLEGDEQNPPPISIQPGCLLVRNFIEAQEAPQSDAQRQREKRARDRENVTKRDCSVTKRDETVTGSHGPSQPVTTCHSVPSCTDPSRTEPEPDARARVERLTPRNEHGKPTARGVLARYGAIRAEVCGGKALFWQPNRTAVEKASEWLDGMPVDAVADIEPAIRRACEAVKAGSGGWADTRMADPVFLFGAIVSRWSALREELHGCAPKPVAQKPSAQQTGQKPVIWRTT